MAVLWQAYALPGKNAPAISTVKTMATVNVLFCYLGARPFALTKRFEEYR